MRKRRMKRIMGLLVAILVTSLTFVTPVMATMTSEEDMAWARNAELDEVRNKLSDLQKYLLPFDDWDTYRYWMQYQSGAGSNQGNADGYRNTLTYTVGTDIITDQNYRSGLNITFCRFDLELPDLPHYNGHDKDVYYYVKIVHPETEWDEIKEYYKNAERTTGGFITNIGGYPANGYYGWSETGYGMEVYVNLQDLMPWAVDNKTGRCILNFRVNSHGSEEQIAEGKRVGELIMNWQPKLSDPVVIGADPELFEKYGIKTGGLDIVVDTYAEDEPGEDSTISSNEDDKSGKKEGNKERDKDEDKKSKGHEDRGTTIPAIIILGTLGTAGAAAAAGAAGSGSEKPDGSDEKKRSTFKMYINKDFGNQLKKGDEPKAVYARIVERKPSGEEVDRTDLTEQIQVFSSDGSLVVTDGGMSTNGYRCAMACVPDVDEPEPEGKVSFFFEGEGGTFTQNVIFNIAIPGIKFFQDNLTLPAGELDEPEFLPFEVQEMGDKYDIEVSYNGEDYEIDLAECDDPEMKDVHYVALMEKNKQVFDAGVYTESWVNVTVKNETQKITASVKIIRMSMGLNVTVKALNCYRVPKKESAGKEMKKMTIADFETATTEAMAYVLYYDKEEHVVRQQAAFPSVILEPLDGETEERKKQVSESLAQIKINCKLLRTEDNFSVCTFICEGGFLDAPARYNVKLCMTAEIPVGEGEKQHMVKYQAERIVLLRSQPSRVVAGVKENYEVDKYDDQITDMLYQIKKIVFDNYMNNLFSLYHMIDRMVDGYDRAYGYDPYQVAKVVDVWERFQSGEMLGANAEAKGYGVADELEALAAATRSWDGWQGIVLRISLDVMTGGASEIAMVALDMNRGAMDYRKETGGKGTAFGYFKAAGIPLLFGAGFGVAAAVGKGASKLVGTQAKKLFPKKTAALLKKAEAVKNTAKEMAELAAKDAKAAAGYVSSVIPQGAKTASAKIGNLVNAVVETVDSIDPRLYVPKAKMANSVVSTSVNKGKTTGDALIGEAKAAQKNIREKCIDMAGNATNKEGEIIYNEMIAAKKALQADPTSGAAQLRYNQSLMEFKASHAAIEHANSIMPGQELNMRQLIGDDLERTLTSRVEEKLKTKIANKYNIDPKTVKIDRATANKGAGLKLGRDCDMTPKVVTKEGGTKYVSQATADELLEESVRETIEETCGKGYANKFAKKGKFSQKMDFTGCTVQHADYFQGGLDTVQQVTDKARMSEFMGAEQARSVADTLRYKGVHPYEAGAKLEKEVLSKLTDGEANALLKELEAYAKADASVAKTMQLSENAKKLKEAYALMEEGLYQPSKYGKKVVEKEWVSIKAGYGETLTGQDYVNARILDRGSGQALTEEMKHRTEEWVGERITLSEARKACELNGTTIENAIKGVGDAFEKLDKNFKYGSVSTVTSAVGIGGAINAGWNATNGSKKK
ncbi:MAG: hypothetical protein IKQ25_00960 [Lachnospiraceae bacterium]|nr:hypothetical protein [Lachnospiraceae bacterium]MBR6149828.1 hypothetical protein [Lachnospiraceae bacterium]